MKTSLLLLLLTLVPNFSHASSERPWFRDAGEYFAYHSVRQDRPTDPSSMLVTDGKRFDVTIGKRVALHTWAKKGWSTAWAFGVDGGMLASLERSNRNGHFVFATNTFDGFFGAWIAKGLDGWLFMFRTAHLSAHLVDNSPRIASPISYSHFWNEIIVGKTFPHPDETSDWEVHFQGSVGLNNTSIPKYKQPRAAVGVTAGYALNGPDSFAILASADILNAGVQKQSPSQTYFLGFGTLNRPQTTHRPFRAGIAMFRGSDYRNQLFQSRARWTTFQLAMDF